MDHLKTKVIGVLKEREDSAVNASNAANNSSNTTTAVAPRQFPKLTALDLAGILNCRRRLEWTKEWLKKNQTQFMTKENLQKETQFRINESYPLNPFFDITEKQFRFLVSKLAPVITSYEPHRKKKAFSAEERLAITFKYLATGEVHSCRNYCFRASKPVILKMIADICLNMYDQLKDQFVSTPKTEELWQHIVKSLQEKHKLPNCIGNVTMKRIEFYTNPRSEDWNKEKPYSTNPPLIFTALVDNYKHFMYVDVERTTATNAEDIFENSKWKNIMESNEFPLPADYAAKETDVASAYYFVGNGALPQKSYLVSSVYYVPTSQDPSYCFTRFNHPEFEYCYGMDAVNYYSSDALQMLGNIFPILALPLRIEEENARKIILGCVALYNFLRKTDTTFYQQSERICDEEEEIIDDDDAAKTEERREEEENRPFVNPNNCFHFVRKQKGDTSAGEKKRAWLMEYIAAVKKEEKEKK